MYCASLTFLARVSVSQTGYKYAGAYYWIVGRTKDKTGVCWVSRDYFIYADPLSHFELSLSLLEERFP